MSNKDLYLEDGTIIKWFERTYDCFLNITTLVYGRTRSGKSTLVLEILYLLKDHISIPFVVSQSNAADYVGKVPKNCIKNNVTKEWLEDFLVAQKGRANLYNKANDMKTLKILFDKIKTPQIENVERMILSAADKYIRNIESNPKLDYPTKKEQIKTIQEMQVKRLVELYKTNIRGYKHILDGMIDKLSRDEICCLNYIDFVPHTLLILDDCAAVFKKWVKESTVIKEIFYNGRWAYITFIITTQDDKDIESELRKNAMISYFTTAAAATANFTRTSNAFPKHERIRAAACIERVFKASIDDKVKNFRKLVYKQNTDDPFMYTIAEIYDDFRIGCPALWQLNDKIEASTPADAKEDSQGFFNKYYDM